MEKMGVEMMRDTILARKAPSQKASLTAGLGLKGYSDMYCSLYGFTSRASNTMETDNSVAVALRRAQVYAAEQRLGRKEIGKFLLLVPHWPLLEITTECSIK